MNNSGGTLACLRGGVKGRVLDLRGKLGKKRRVKG